MLDTCVTKTDERHSKAWMQKTLRWVDNYKSEEIDKLFFVYLLIIIEIRNSVN